MLGSLMSSYNEFQTLTVYETDLSELCHEVFKQMACKNATTLDPKKTSGYQSYPQKMKKLLPSFYEKKQKANKSP